MAGRIADADIAAVRDRVRIDDVVSEHVTLRSAGGGSLKGLCPFHDERTPSFHVTPSKGLYYCFGCGAGGDAIDFLIAVDHLSFAEAVEKLAGRTGVTLHYEGGTAGSSGADGGQRAQVVAVNRASAGYFAGQLDTPAAERARQFLLDRGFPADVWPTFGLGYAPRHGLVAHLRGAGFAEQAIVASGVAGQGEGRTYDRFRDRLIWPIRDLSGDVVGFGARRLAEEAGPKYLNTPETVVYKKSQVLYGLHEARRDIAREHRAVVVEGYTDVMACHLAGVTTAVATCGTAFGAGHVRVLRRLLLDDAGGQVVFTFDGDAAGRKAAVRAYEEDQQFASRTYVAVARDGMDPCDLRLRFGDEAVRDLVGARVPLFEFVLRTGLAELDLRTAEGRAQGVRTVAPILAGIRDETLRPEYARQVAGWLGTDTDQVMRQVERVSRGARSARGPNQPGSGRTHGPAGSPRSPASPGWAGSAGSAGSPASPGSFGPAGSSASSGPAASRGSSAAPGSDVEQPRSRGLRAELVEGSQGRSDPPPLERQALQVMLQQPELVRDWTASVEPDCFTDERLRAVFLAVQAADDARSSGPVWIRTVLDGCSDDDERRIVRALATSPLPADPQDASFGIGVLARLLDHAAFRRAGALRAALGAPGVAEDSQRQSELLGDLMALEEYRRMLRGHWAGE